jgi:hypothetical protein
VRHVDEQIGADRIGDLAEFLEVEITRVGEKPATIIFGFSASACAARAS